MRFASLIIGAIALIAGCTDDTPPHAGARNESASARTQVTQAPAPSDPGRRLYDHHCAGCHDAGPGHPGTMRLTVRVGDLPAALLARNDLAPAAVEEIVRSGTQMMPPFRPTEIVDEELAALAAYVAQNYAGM